MAKSSAAKMRKKNMNQGSYDVTNSRGTWGELVPVVRKAKTKKDTLQRFESKHKKNRFQEHSENGPFYIQSINSLYSARYCCEEAVQLKFSPIARETSFSHFLGSKR